MSLDYSLGSVTFDSHPAHPIGQMLTWKSVDIVQNGRLASHPQLSGLGSALLSSPGGFGLHLWDSLKIITESLSCAGH